MDEVVSVTDDAHYSLSKLVAKSILYAKELELTATVLLPAVTYLDLGTL